MFKLSVHLGWVEFFNLSSLSVYFCYYSWVSLYFLILFIDLTVLFQLTFTFMRIPYSYILILSITTLWESHIANSFKLASVACEVEGFTVMRSPSVSGGWEVCDCERAMMGPRAMIAHDGTQIAKVARLIVVVIDGC